MAISDFGYWIADFKHPRRLQSAIRNPKSAIRPMGFTRNASAHIHPPGARQGENSPLPPLEESEKCPFF
jgi:hypothetical protein